MARFDVKCDCIIANIFPFVQEGIVFMDENNDCFLVGPT